MSSSPVALKRVPSSNTESIIDPLISQNPHICFNKPVDVGMPPPLILSQEPTVDGGLLMNSVTRSLRYPCSGDSVKERNSLCLY